MPTRDVAKLVLAADLIGTAVFAFEGAVAAMQGGLDLLGVLVLSFTVALGGGVIRDVLIGATPPAAVRNWHYPALAFATGLATFTFHSATRDVPPMLLMTLDAAGLAVFAVAGTLKALDCGIVPFVAALMGAITGVGGGVLRDMLLVRVPMVLVANIYASAALAGTLVLIASCRLSVPPVAAALAGGGVCFALRVASVIYGWQLPKVLHP